ncbi:hypothetical protein [Acinetobacter sp. 102]|uniref:hypothetical protein n=1 Tax=Acinetobacter sp. 102 TaxID=3098766 RepID=UPI0030096AC0
MKCTVYRLPNADFNGQGLPTLFPYIAKESLSYAFDLAGGSLKDLTGKTANLVPYRTTSAVGGGTRVIDPTVITQLDNAIKITSGCLVSSVPFKPIPIDGTVQFSIMFIGGWDGSTIPEAATAPYIATYLDIGNGVTANNAPMMQFNSSDKTLGARFKTGSSSNIGTVVSNVTRLYFMVLTYNGLEWTLHNKTLGTVVKKTNAELGQTAQIPVASGLVPLFHYIGHGHLSSTIAGLPVVVSQVANWNRVLSSTEIETQYQMSKAQLNNVI